MSGYRADNGNIGAFDKIIVPLAQWLTNRFSKADEPSHASSKSILLGTTSGQYDRSRSEAVRVDATLLLKHLYLVGATGLGKTFCLFLLVCELIRCRCGFAVIDIHGDLTTMLLRHFATLRRDPGWKPEIDSRLGVWEPFDPAFALKFNPLAARNSRECYVNVNDLLHHFRKAWADVWGPRMDEIFRNALLTLSLQGRPLGDIRHLLTNPTFRRDVTAGVDDNNLRDYWQYRFQAMSPALQATAVQPVLNKVSPLLDDLYLRDLFAQRETAIDFRTAMDEGQWLLINVAKGVAGANAHLIGSMFVSRIRTAAMSRVELPEGERVPFTLMVDEFQNFLNYDFEEILSEARKFGLGLVMAHQHLGQLERSMRETIIGNVATALFFRLGYRDIREIIGAFRPAAQPIVSQILGQLAVAEAILRPADGSYRKVNIQKVARPTASAEEVQELKELSHRRFYTERRNLRSFGTSLQADLTETNREEPWRIERRRQDTHFQLHSKHSGQSDQPGIPEGDL